MSDHDFPPALIDLQKASTLAWVAVEEHRKGVDEVRRREAVESGARPDESRPWAPRPLRSWSEAEDAEHAQLLDAAREAAAALRAGIAEAGLDGGYDVTQGLHKAARASA